MVKKDVEIRLSGGLEARPVAVLVQIASQFDSKIYLGAADGKKVNAKSIMGMMTLGLPVGEKVSVEAEGADAEASVDAIEKYLTSQE